MQDKQLATVQPSAASVLEKVVIEGDLSKLSPADRVRYYRLVCESLGLNPLTKPFDYIILNGKLTLYARKDATEQLRRTNNISIQIVAREVVGDLYIVTARAVTPDGRTDEAVGAVSLEGLRGESKANAIMKAETKAKRRVTLSICGLGWTDESEIASIPDAQAVSVDIDTGEITSAPVPAQAVTDDRAREIKRLFAMLRGDPRDPKYGATNKGLTNDEAEALVEAAEEKAGKPLEEWTAEEVKALADVLRKISPEKLRARAHEQLSRGAELVDAVDDAEV